MHNRLLDTKETMPWPGVSIDQGPSRHKQLWFENLGSFLSDQYLLDDRNPMALFFVKENSKVVLNDMYTVRSFELPKTNHCRLQIPL